MLILLSVKNDKDEIVWPKERVGPQEYDYFFNFPRDQLDTIYIVSTCVDQANNELYINAIDY